MNVFFLFFFYIRTCFGRPADKHDRPRLGVILFAESPLIWPANILESLPLRDYFACKYLSKGRHHWTEIVFIFTEKVLAIKHVRHFEPVYYDNEALHQQHHVNKRSTNAQIGLVFEAFDM